jgi:glutamyl/glutaminyl-tRNA synthetase
MEKPYTGRLAPSPTGLLHLGHARTFWTAYQRAKNGTLYLRNDDLDPHRSKKQFVDAMIEDLHWLGITWTEPIVNQSERMPLYRAALEKLIAQGNAYECTCTRKDLAASTQAPHEDEDDEPIYNGKCRPSERICHSERSEESHPANATANVSGNITYRFRIEDTNPIHFEDQNLGPQTFTPGKDFGDFLLWSRDGIPSYQLASVVDDAEMRITEVVRGADLLKSTARQILLQRALHLPTPQYFHCDLLRDANNIRLAKRHDALALRTLRAAGQTPAEILALFQ